MEVVGVTDGADDIIGISLILVDDSAYSTFIVLVDYSPADILYTSQAQVIHHHGSLIFILWFKKFLVSITIFCFLAET